MMGAPIKLRVKCPWPTCSASLVATCAAEWNDQGDNNPIVSYEAHCTECDCMFSLEKKTKVSQQPQVWPLEFA